MQTTSSGLSLAAMVVEEEEAAMVVEEEEEAMVLEEEVGDLVLIPVQVFRHAV